MYLASEALCAFIVLALEVWILMTALFVNSKYLYLLILRKRECVQN